MAKKSKKRKPVLRRQAVKKRKAKSSSKTWRATRFLFSFSLKFSCLLAGLMLISLSFLYLYENLLTSPYVRLQRVVVNGVDEKLKHALLRMSELTPDTSLLSVHLNELKQRMEKHPWIRSVNLKKRFPHTLVIEAKKEEPYAIVVLNDLHYMNRWGKLFRKVDESESMDFPLVTGITSSDSDGEKQLQLAARVLRFLEEEQGLWSHSQLSELHVEKTDHVSLYFLSLPAVIDFEGTELERKMGDLKRLVKHLKKTGRIQMVERINLNFREGAVVSYKNDGVVS
jgi:cell division septal protein FtsQ